MWLARFSRLGDKLGCVWSGLPSSGPLHAPLPWQVLIKGAGYYMEVALIWRGLGEQTEI